MSFYSYHGSRTSQELALEDEINKFLHNKNWINVPLSFSESNNILHFLYQDIEVMELSYVLQHLRTKVFKEKSNFIKDLGIAQQLISIFKPKINKLIEDQKNKKNSSNELSEQIKKLIKEQSNIKVSANNEFKNQKEYTFDSNKWSNIKKS